MKSGIFKTIYYIFIVFIGAMALLLVVSTFPIPGNIKLMIVQSGSMEPAIKMGSIVLVKPVNDYKIGDVIAFGQVAKTKAPISHRIYEIKTSESGQPIYITKGDANDNPDPREISKKEILGKVLFDVSFLGYVINTVKQPYGFMVLILVPATIIIFDEIKKIKNEVVRIRQKNKNKNS